MSPTFGVLIRAALLVAGTSWCWLMSKQWRADFQEFASSKDFDDRVVIAIPWLATGVIALWVVSQGLEIVGRLVGAFL